MEYKYIWLKTEEKDSYAEFKDVFNYAGGGAEIKITADYKYAVFVNGAFAANGQFADVPSRKAFSSHDITKFLKEGENTLLIKAYHMGEGHFQCFPMPASVAYAVISGGKTLVRSGEKTLCRKEAHYLSGDILTGQIGEWYNYTFTAKELPWEPCREVFPGFTPCDKPVKNTAVKGMTMAEVTAQGTFILNGGETSALKMQRAYLSSRHFNEMTGQDKTEHNGFIHPLTFSEQGGDGIYMVFDLKKECAGYLDFSLECEKETSALLGWGEHLTDLRPRTYRGGRNFGFSIKFKAGENVFSEYLRRIGGRYFILFVHADKVKINYFGLHKELYPFNKPAKDFGDGLLNEIYKTARRTLELCAHEHYEDCPWREQALYGMDSRNQMLFGYGAFHEYEYPRANLKMFAASIEEDGLFPICPPSVSGLTIPSFSAYWLWAVCENAAADFNAGFIKEIMPAAKRVFAAFMKNSDNGAVKVFEGERYWNFHEWSAGLTGARFDGGNNPAPKGYDGNLTALLYRAARDFAVLSEKIGDGEFAVKLKEFAESLFGGMLEFYDEKAGVFASYREGDKKSGHHQLTQAVFLTAAAGRLPSEMAESARKSLYEPNDLVPVTLAGLQLKYAAMLEKEELKSFVLEDVKERFKKMLFSGATSFWETEKGEEDFDGAGSLCHGWSAVACYVLDNLCVNVKK